MFLTYFFKDFKFSTFLKFLHLFFTFFSNFPILLIKITEVRAATGVGKPTISRFTNYFQKLVIFLKG